MKVLFVLGYPNPFPGAAWTRIGFFADAWSKKGHSIEVLGTFSYETFKKRGNEQIGKVNIFNPIFNMGLQHPFVFAVNVIISFMVSALFLFSRRHDVVIVSVPTGDVGLGALLACRLRRIKCIVDYRDRWEDYTNVVATGKTGKSFYCWIKKLMTRIYASCNLVIAVTPGVASHLNGQGLANIRILPNGADVTIFRPLNRQRETVGFMIVYVGGVVPYYRLDLVIKALRSLSSMGLEDIRLILVGEGQEILANTLDSNIKDKIVFLGEISDLKKLSEVIARSDVGIIPLAGDYIQAKTAYPAKFFEYCACGVPVIATVSQDSQLAELIREHKVGLLASPEDEKELTVAIYRLYKNRLLRKAAGKRARALIEKKFDRNIISNSLLTVVEQIVHNAVCESSEEHLR